MHPPPRAALQRRRRTLALRLAFRCDNHQSCALDSNRRRPQHARQPRFCRRGRRLGDGTVYHPTLCAMLPTSYSEGDIACTDPPGSSTGKHLRWLGPSFVTTVLGENRLWAQTFYRRRNLFYFRRMDWELFSTDPNVNALQFLTASVSHIYIYTWLALQSYGSGGFGRRVSLSSDSDNDHSRGNSLKGS
jgi:hypothetical protein